ncbi:cytochrome P450 [Cristinia sonorae]|uniref:Cytochrome P450 n=1 Tax=Cristinia sonorae TaxID=1940300 RepID=A0A8K0XKZ2_9AGAR|nr:cytochrome P450 [Cristinia sonorae]
MISLSQGAPAISVLDAVFVTVAVGLLTHIYFNRFEPFRRLPLIVSLLFLPFCLSVVFLPHFSIPSSIAIAFLTFHATLLTSIALYRVSPFHPLSGFPGPMGLKLSALWVYKTAADGKRHLYIQRLHQQYNSDVVRIGPNEISFRDATAIVPIMGPNGLPKGPMWDGRTRYSSNRALIGWRDLKMHAKRRRPWTLGLSTAAIKEYEPTLAERVEQLACLAMKFEGQTVDLADFFRKFSFDFMGDMAFGGGSELMRDGDVDGSMQLLLDGIADSNVSGILPWFRYHIPSALNNLITQTAARATARIQNGTQRKDLFHYLNNEDGSAKESPPLSVVVAEGRLVTIAGSDTTSATLSNILFLLLTHRNEYKRLQEEIDRFYPPGENSLDSSFHPEMHFLDAVINETLRLYPVIPSGSQRATQRRGTLINSLYVPPNTSVRVHTWSVHRDPRNFSPFTDAFWPERWLIADDPSSVERLKIPFTHNVNAYHPFSYGPANCVGKGLALKELKMVICRLLQQAEIRLQDGYDLSEWERIMKDCYTLEVGRLPVVISPRCTD